MSTAPYSVSVVLDRDYGHRLRELLNRGPVWAVDSAVNRECAQGIWMEQPDLGHLEGLTIFKASDNSVSEDMLIGEMRMIDLHHGIDSADPPYTVLHVIGCSITEEVQEVLKSFDFDSLTETSVGFDATRPMPSEF